jgi:putative flippase GtrA
MHNYEFGPSGDPSHYSGFGETHADRPHRSVFGLVVTIVVVAVLAAAGLGVAFWALGLLFHLLGWILRVAILAAVAAFVWHRLCRRWSSRSHSG